MLFAIDKHYPAKSAPYLHQKSANCELNEVFFLFIALVLILLTKFVPNTQIAPLQGTVPASIFLIRILNFPQIASTAENFRNKVP